MMTEMRALLERLAAAGLSVSESIEAAMLAVNIEDYSDWEPSAFWHDHPLIFLRTESGGVKTISAPHMVVTMLGHLELELGQDVLILGAKGGYMAALISHIVGDSGSVTVVDPSRPVVEHVRERLVVSGRGGNGKGGEIRVRKLSKINRAPPHLPTPLQRVLITGSIREIPKWIDTRLHDGGFVIAPLGNRFGQRLIKRERQDSSRLDTDLGGVIFGPVDIAETESNSSVGELADMFEEAAAIADELDALEVEDRIRLRQLSSAIRDLPDDLPPLRRAVFEHDDTIPDFTFDKTMQTDNTEVSEDIAKLEEGGNPRNIDQTEDKENEGENDGTGDSEKEYPGIEVLNEDEEDDDDSYLIEIAFSALDSSEALEHGDHPLIDLLWAEMEWLGPILAVLESLLDFRMQHPGDPSQPTTSFEGGFGSHDDLVP